MDTEDAKAARRARRLMSAVARIVENGVPRAGGDSHPCLEDDWSSATIDERIAGVWTLTRLAMGWERDEDIPRLDRSKVRIVRYGQS